ncbi:carbohydrate ABC transporter permease [Cuneatibacter caecimuris]|uniref:Carbohydrate ABC transporter membrane protein 2 (CUT1 family) n=1 Tax=Cuneatibacter caecimuris TaxID=1796618 RepID=A0A4Q7P6E3_9FIRM|nr:carbohydrate ABC transporter membrane protein 2 (CUT1 family) [Cuneatibacter caecimuris]
MKHKKGLRAAGLIFKYLLLAFLGLILIFPLIYMFFGSFKSNQEIFGTLKLLPESFHPEGYIEGWKGSGQITFGAYIWNSFLLVVPTVALTVVSSILTAYGFNRFRVPGRKVLFAVMMALMMLPASVLLIPRYLLYVSFGWIDTYLVFWVPAACATSSFFVYMFVQFFEGVPRELDEAARIDGCSSFQTLVRILVPLSKPAVISAVIFQFIWTWNDFFQQYVYISSVGKYTVSLGLRMALDATSAIQWKNILAMSVIAMVPCTLIYFVLQRYFVEGIATSGLKG